MYFEAFSSDDEDFCERCGRDGHYVSECYAEFDIEGERIIDSNSCKRCGRSNHNTLNCFAKVDKNGKYIKDIHTKQKIILCGICGENNHNTQNCPNAFIEEEEEEEEICSKCGRNSHNQYNCFAKTDINGRTLNQRLFVQSSLNNSEDMVGSSQPFEDVITIDDDDEFFCSRCGRDSHITQDCFATYAINGEYLDDDESDDDDVFNEFDKPKREYLVDQNDVFYNSHWLPLILVNLQYIPNDPAVYEIAQSRSGTGATCAYVGHTGNLKERLLDHCLKERKGRSPSNIRHKTREAESNKFDIFFRYSIMKSKGHAEAIEQNLLDSFDYAWNLMDNEKTERRTIQ